MFSSKRGHYVTLDTYNILAYQKKQAVPYLDVNASPIYTLFGTKNVLTAWVLFLTVSEIFHI